MTKISVHSLDYYNKKVIEHIIEKYGYDPMTAAKKFLTSETHRMLEDPDMAMWEFSDLAIFNIWESEMVTGDPRNSIYIRGE